MPLINRDVEELSARAAAHATAGRLAKACLLYEQIIAGGATDGDARYELAKALVRRGRYDEAIVQFKAALRLIGYGTPARQRSTIRARKHGLLLGLGKAHRAAGHNDEALATFTAIIGDSSDVDRTVLAEAHDEIGEIHRVRNDYEGAVRDYAAAVAADNRRIETRLHWAALLQYDRHDDAGALGQLIEALAIDPASNEVHRALVPMLRRADRDADVARIDGLIGAVSSPPAHLAWADTLRLLGRAEPAQRSLLTALKLGAGIGPTADRTILHQLGDILPPAATEADVAPISALLDDRGDSSARAEWAGVLANRPAWKLTALTQLELVLRQNPRESLAYWTVPATLDAPDLPADIRERAIGSIGDIVEASAVASAHIEWAAVLQTMNRNDHAERFLRRGIAMLLARGDAVDVDALQRIVNNLSWFPDAIVEPHLKDLGSLVDATDAVPVIFRWAGFLGDRGRKDDARRHLRRAVMLDPTIPLADVFRRRFGGPEIDPGLVELLERSTDAASHLTWAEVLAGRGDHDGALAAALRATELNPESADAWQQAAAAHAKRNAVEAALACFERAVDADPVSGSAYVAWAAALKEFEAQDGAAARLATVLGGLGLPRPENVPWSEIEAAQAALVQRVQRLVERIERHGDAKEAWIYVSIGVEAFRLARYDEARRLFARAAQLAPTDDWASYDLGLTCALLNDFPAAIAAYTNAIAHRADNLYTYLNRARAYTAMRQYADADRDFRLGLESTTDPDDKSADGATGRANIWANWSATAGAAGEHESAREKASRAVAMGGDDFLIRLRFGNVLDDAGYSDEAVAAYADAVKIDAEHPYAHHNIASIWSKQIRTRLAMPRWESVRVLYQKRLGEAIRRRDVDYCVYYGDMCRDVFADYPMADLLLRVARFLGPTSVMALTATVRLALERQRALDRRPVGADSWDSELTETRARLRLQAAETYRTAERLLNQTPPTDATGTRQAGALLQLAELHLLVDDLDKAEAAARQVAAVDKSPTPVKFLGEALLGVGRYPEAIQKLRLAVRSAPEDLHVRLLLGRALLKAGALDEAKRAFEDVLDIARFHVQALIGSAEVCLDIAAKVTDDSDGAIREELYSRAIETLTKAIDIAHSPDRPIGMHEPPASAYYLRGYARVKIWEIRRRAWERDYVRAALADFRTCLALDPRHPKARQAVERTIEARARGRSRIERSVPAMIIGAALVLLLVAHVGFLIGLPSWPYMSVLTPESLASLRAANVGPDIVASLRSIEGVRFRSEEALLARAKSLIEEKHFERVKGSLLAHVVRMEGARELARMDATAFGLMVFGALIFMVAGAYLPQLTALRLPGLQLEKSSADRVEAVFSLGISREESGARGVGR